MQLAPKDILEKLEFTKIRDLLERECYGELGRRQVAALVPLTDRALIERKLDEVLEYRLGLDEKDSPELGPYEDVADELRMLDIEGYVLPEEGLRQINRLLVYTRRIFQFFGGSRRQTYPTLYSIIRELEFNPELSKEIERVIDEEGNIRPDASPELSAIRRMTGSKVRELERTFKSVIEKFRKNGWLADTVESIRNGRRVLAVPSEHKRKIRGIIHDESATGKTAFIEPDAVISINNDIFDLEQEEKREIYRILKELSAKLRPYSPLLRVYRDLIVIFDVIQAKARLAGRLKAGKPILKNGPHLGIKEARHPLLLLKNRGLGKKVVPFDLQLFGRNRILVLSGPNAGGKSVTMKAVGLLQLMLQSGLLVPVADDSEMGVFQKIFADIGDQQSLEDDLSTYSSRLANARAFLEGADDQTLALIDEFGSGTDPKIGGAIAEAILDELHQKKIYGVITTHYSNLKIYAFKTKGIVNGSMHFDKDQLTPTYELHVGRPGSSYAFEIADKSGLPGRVMKYARRRIGKNENAVDQLLVDLQREKQETEEILAGLQRKQETLNNLMRTYEELHRDMEFRRKRLKLEAKEAALQEVAQQNKELETAIREIREAKNLEKAQALATKVREERKELADNVTDLRENIYYKDADKQSATITVGDAVKLRVGGATGIVDSVDRKRAIVLVGDMRMTVNLRDLQPIKNQIETRPSRSITSDVHRVASFESKLDLRGMRYEEALQLTEAFIDQALIAGSDTVRILHGKGSGALKKAVHRKLREYTIDLKISHPPKDKGGDGVTIVEI